MDESTQEEPIAWSPQDARYRAGFKLEELVEFLRAASNSEEDFDSSVAYLHKALDKAADKVRSKSQAEVSLVGQVDALIDTLYFTYGSFVLMGVDPEQLFDIVHRANMGKIFPDGKAHFDPVTHKILKPDDWEEKIRSRRSYQRRTGTTDSGLPAYLRAERRKQRINTLRADYFLEIFALFLFYGTIRKKCRGEDGWINTKLRATYQQQLVMQQQSEMQISCR